jgi:hypothetical protein
MRRTGLALPQARDRQDLRYHSRSCLRISLLDWRHI